MQRLIQQIRSALLATEDTVCLERARLVIEAWQRYESEPPPLRRAKTFAHVLRHMTLDVASNPIFAGNTSSRPRARMLVPEHGFGTDTQGLIENGGLDGLLDAAANYHGGTNLNLTLPAGDTSSEAVLTLVEGFFDQGGQELQGNCLDAATLRAARERPEAYGGLVVRVAGFSTRFVDLAPAEQDELIARADAVG